MVLLRRIGAGATGEVWRAWHLVLRRAVAAKLPLLAAGDATRLVREGRLLGQLDHPNVVRRVEAADAEEPLLVMELVDGWSLGELVRVHGAFPVAWVLPLLSGAARGVAAMHRAGIVHQDLKPSNLMVDRCGRVKVVDLGISARTDEPRGERSVGTPSFMSPERLDGAAGTPSSDVWGLGLTLFTLLAGRIPLEASGVAPCLLAARPDCPPQVVDLYQRCTTDRDGRGAGSLVEWIDALVPRFGGDLAGLLCASEAKAGNLWG